MMRRRVAVGLFVVLEHRELGHDQRFVRRAVDQILTFGDLYAQRSERCRDDRFAAGDDQNEIAFIRV